MLKRVATVAVVGVALLLLAGCTQRNKGVQKKGGTEPPMRTDEEKYGYAKKNLEGGRDDKKKLVSSMKVVVKHGDAADIPLLQKYDVEGEDAAVRAAAKEGIQSLEQGKGAGGKK